MSAAQAVGVAPMRHETVKIPSQTQAAWSTTTTFVLQETESIYHRAVIEVNLPAVTGLTGVDASYPRFQPAPFFAQRIDLQIGNVTVQSLIPDDVFTRQNLWASDESRALQNHMMGPYNSVAGRVSRADEASSYFIDLTSWLSTNHPLIVNAVHAVTIKVVWASLAEVVEVGSTLTGTAACVMTNAYLLLELSRVQHDAAVAHYTQLVRNPIRYAHLSCLYTQQPLASGTTSYQILLSNVVGKVSHLVFFIRSLATPRGAATIPILSFDILNSSGTPFNPSTVIRAEYGSYHRRWVPSTFLLENTASYGAVTDNQINHVVYSFNAHPREAESKGQVFNTATFVGTESLRITCGSLAASSELVCLSYIVSCVELSASGGKSINL